MLFSVFHIVCDCFSCLWFVLEPLIGRAEDYNYAFLRRMIEKIKQTKDAQGPEDEEMNKVRLICISEFVIILYILLGLSLLSCHC